MLLKVIPRPDKSPYDKLSKKSLQLLWLVWPFLNLNVSMSVSSNKQAAYMSRSKTLVVGKETKKEMKTNKQKHTHTKKESCQVWTRRHRRAISTGKSQKEKTVEQEKKMWLGSQLLLVMTHCLQCKAVNKCVRERDVMENVFYKRNKMPMCGPMAASPAHQMT